MKEVLQKKVVSQQIDGKPIEDYMADMLARTEKEAVDKEKLNIQIALLKQMNNRHKNVIDAVRVEARLTQTAGGMSFSKP